MSFRETAVHVKRKEPLDVGGNSIPCFLVTAENAGIRMDLWVDETGRIWKQTTPSGWVMLRESRQEALTAGWPSGAGIDMISATSVRAKGRKISTPSRARFMSVLIPLDSPEGLDLDGRRQEQKQGSFQPVKITREELNESEAPDLPITDPELAPYLASSLLVQADHPEIRKQALAIAGDETNSLRAAGRILEWIHENVEQRAVPTLPNALEVLHHRSGDCNECTVLYVALARAMGLPARANAGLVYMDGNFYYHAWPEVFAGRWITLDPVFGQLPADATHLRLTTGGIEKQVEIAKLIGRLKEIHVLDVQYD
jgi:transglutaminase-like putative cysteine protease